MTKNITLAIDGDILVYKSALASQQVGYNITLKSGTIYPCTSYMVLKRKLKELNLSEEEVTIEEAPVLKNNYLTYCENSIQFMVSTIVKDVRVEIRKVLKEPFKISIKMCIGGPTNFRKDLPLFHKYKDRKGDKPLALKDAAELMQKLYECDVSDGIEADDRVSMFGYSGYKDMSVIAVTEDKDAKQTPMWLFIPRKKELLDCGGFGEIQLNHTVNPKGTKKYKLEGKGRFWLYYQVVSGDPVDTYCPFAPRVTELKFYNMFKHCQTDEECWSLIYGLFKKHYGHLDSYTDWTGKKQKGGAVEILQNYVDVAHMQRWDNDRLDVHKLLTNYKLI